MEQSRSPFRGRAHGLGEERRVSLRFPTVKPVRAVLPTSSWGDDPDRQTEKQKIHVSSPASSSEKCNPDLPGEAGQPNWLA